MEYSIIGNSLQKNWEPNDKFTYEFQNYFS